MNARAPQALAGAIRKLPKSKRRAAIQFAESYFMTYLDKLNSFDDFSSRVNYDLAIDATVAELEWVFH